MHALLSTKLFMIKYIGKKYSESTFSVFIVKIFSKAKLESIVASLFLKATFIYHLKSQLRKCSSNWHLRAANLDYHSILFCGTNLGKWWRLETRSKSGTCLPIFLQLISTNCFSMMTRKCVWQDQEQIHHKLCWKLDWGKQVRVIVVFLCYEEYKTKNAIMLSLVNEMKMEMREYPVHD